MLLLFGGQSAEHDVSRVSAVAVARALDPARYEVVPVGITREGRWLLAEAARAALDSGERLEAFMVEGPPVRMGESADLVRVDPRAPSLGPIDVVFPLLHGPYGEDGTVQGLLELAGLPYVGAGVLGSAVGMDKVMMKRAFLACGLPTPAHVPLREDFDKADLDRVEETLGYPCFVKPSNLGSSVGVSRATGRRELEEAVDVALRFDEWVLVEEGITGREIEVAVLGDRPPEASLPGEIIPGADFYTYEDKYLDGRAELRAPADARCRPDRGRAPPGGGRLRGVPLRRHGPGRLLPRGPGPGVPGQRGEHHPGVHAHLHVPEAVGGHRRALRRSARPAGRPRARAPRASPAASGADPGGVAGARG